MPGWRVAALQATAWAMAGLLALLPLLAHGGDVLLSLFPSRDPWLVVVTNPAVEQLSEESTTNWRSALEQFERAHQLYVQLSEKLPPDKAPCEEVAVGEPLLATHFWCMQRLDPGWTALRLDSSFDPWIVNHQSDAHEYAREALAKTEQQYIFLMSSIDDGKQQRQVTAYSFIPGQEARSSSDGGRPLAYIHTDRPATLTVITPTAPPTPTLTPSPTPTMAIVTHSPTTGATAIPSVSLSPTPTPAPPPLMPIRAERATDEEVRRCLGWWLYGTLVVVLTLIRLNVVVVALVAVSVLCNLTALRLLFPLVHLLPTEARPGATRVALILLGIGDAIGVVALIRWALPDALHPIRLPTSDACT